MAPTAPLGRARAIQLVQDGALPVALGALRPSALIVEQDGKFRIRELVFDHDAAAVSGDAARRARSPSWMPEHHYAMGRPTGSVLVEADTRTQLLEQMATMAWPDHW